MRQWVVWSVLSSLLFLNTGYAATLQLRDKIAEMLIVGFDEDEVTKDAEITKWLRADSIGGVILYQRNIKNPKQVKLLNQKLQKLSKSANKAAGRPDLPLLISIDHEGGHVNRLKPSLGFPDTLSAEKIAKKQRDEVHQMADEMAKTLKNLKFNLNFAPLVDVNVNSDNPIIAEKERSFSDNPLDVAQFAGIYSENFLNQGVQCAYKHFPGHGSSTGDTHKGFVDVSKSWQTSELYPYQLLFQQPMHCGMVMTAHTVNRQLDGSGLPATLSHQVLTGLLREKLKFSGVIITDDMQMKAISSHYSLDKALTLTINAGADMIIFGNMLTDSVQSPQDVIDIIEAKVKSGEIKQERINDAYQHIVALKHSVI